MLRENMNSPAKACILPLIIKIEHSHFWNLYLLFGKDTTNISNSIHVRKLKTKMWEDSRDCRFPDAYLCKTLCDSTVMILLLQQTQRPSLSNQIYFDLKEQWLYFIKFIHAKCCPLCIEMTSNLGPPLHILHIHIQNVFIKMNVEPADVPDNIQRKIIELQSNNKLHTKYRLPLLKFYHCISWGIFHSDEPCTEVCISKNIIVITTIWHQTPCQRVGLRPSHLWGQCDTHVFS